MPEILGRLRTPRLAAAPSSPQTGEMYYDTSTNKLMWWDGTQWIGSISGPPGPAGSVEVYSQPTQPASTTVGAMWIDTDETPPTGGVHVGTSAPNPADKQVWVDTDEPDPTPLLPVGHYMLGPYSAASGSLGASGGVAGPIYHNHSIGHTRYTVMGSNTDASYGYNVSTLVIKEATRTQFHFKNHGTQAGSGVVYEFYYVVQP